MMTKTVATICEALFDKTRLLAGSDLDLNAPLNHARDLMQAMPGDIAFCRSTLPDALGCLQRSRATLTIVDRTLPGDFDALVRSQGFENRALILSDNARLDFLRIVQLFFVTPRAAGIHPSSSISATAVVADTAYIGPLCTIGDNVRIGEHTEIHSGCQIYHDVKIGNHVSIQSGVVIGTDGFGYERLPDGSIEKFPHLGDVVIEDGVEIGANSVIDRASLGSTRIGEGTRIDKLVHVAHNCQIGRRCLIVGGTCLGGSVRIGDDAWLGTGTTISNKIEIGTGAYVSLGAVVAKDVKPGQRIIGRSLGFTELPAVETKPQNT
jgi:UDP-3-O-[3-hydroxymyristoyl] glucosamine N-acyltransferase